MNAVPDSSAVRTALWRALHVQLDAPPHLIDDEIGLALAAPDADWRDRPDMHPIGTRDFRAAIVARTRFVEDLIVDGEVGQYVILGAGLDTFVLRHPELTTRVTVFEIDQPGPQEWKRQRLDALGYGAPESLRLVPVDFESGDDWWEALLGEGFDAQATTVVSSSGVSMYISTEATAATLRQLAALAPGSTVVMTFMLPLEMLDAADRPGLEAAAAARVRRARRGSASTSRMRWSRSPRDAGFVGARYLATEELAARYLAGRGDGLRAAGGEGMLIALT